MTETNGEIRDNGGRFLPGNPGKPKGAIIKVSVKVREAIISFLENNVDTIQEDFDKLKPKERLQFVSELFSYATPRLSSVQTEVHQETNHTGKITIEIVRTNGTVETHTGL